MPSVPLHTGFNGEKTNPSESEYAMTLCVLASSPGHSRVFNVTNFLRVTLKTREWPGDEASVSHEILVNDNSFHWNSLSSTINTESSGVKIQKVYMYMYMYTCMCMYMYSVCVMSVRFH